jgi:peptidoglycan/LPS O-acetylase OafA/YrhL
MPDTVDTTVGQVSANDQVAQPSLGYQPALDGVRAIAVLMVLAFHLELPGAQGGYLGVSIFFTLSGFLITRLLITEYDRAGKISMGRFYGRRIRRLLPASLLAMALVIALAAAGIFGASARIFRGTLAALTSTFNWYELLGGREYANLFAEPSPLAHFWSLAIEEQFYWLWPLTMVALLPRVPVRRRTTMLVVLAGAASLTAPLTATLWSSSAAYLATWARSGEILIGAALGGWTLRSKVPAWCSRFAAPSLLVIFAITAVTPAGRGWAFEGWLPVFALVSATLVISLLVESRTSSVLGIAPLVWIGSMSYGIYLFHWPVILWLSPDRTGLGRWPAIALQLAVTLGLTTLSFYLVERPIRAGRIQPSSVFAGTLGAASIAVLAAAWIFAPSAALTLPDAPLVISAPSTNPSRVTATSAPTETPVATSPEPVTMPTSIAIFGDSVPAWLLRDAAPSYDRQDVEIANGSAEACDGMVDLPTGRDRHFSEWSLPDDCAEWTFTYPATLAATPNTPTIGVLVLGQAPTADRFVDGEWLHPCDSIDWYLADVANRVDYLRNEGLTVVFALPARPGTGATYVLPDDVDARFACVRDTLTPFLESLDVAIVDLDNVLCPADDCDRIRTIDGVHVDPEFAPEVLDWLLDESLAVAN